MFNDVLNGTPCYWALTIDNYDADQRLCTLLDTAAVARHCCTTVRQHLFPNRTHKCFLYMFCRANVEAWDHTSKYIKQAVRSIWCLAGSLSGWGVIKLPLPWTLGLEMVPRRADGLTLEGLCTLTGTVLSWCCKQINVNYEEAFVPMGKK